MHRHIEHIIASAAQKTSLRNLCRSRSLRLILIFTLCIFQQARSQQINTAVTELDKAFTSPPSIAKPWVFWYWHRGAISREGITADLQAMKQAGIGGAYLMFIRESANPPLMDSSLVQLTPAWWKMVRHAMEEARRLQLQLGMHVSDGFALAGGPWITPELSMQKLVWSQTNTSGNRRFNDTLPRPEMLEGYYKDIAVFAYPSPAGTGLSTRSMQPVISSSKPDSAASLLAQPRNRRTFGCDEQCWVQYEFPKPFTCRTITIRSRNNYQSNRLIIQVSNDGRTFRQVARLEPPRHGWQDWDADYTHVIPATTAKYFRFVFDKSGTEPGAEDLDAAKWKPSLRVSGIEVSSEPRIHQYEGKNGEVWRISSRTTPAQVPDSICVPLKKIIRLTTKMDSNGRLVWDVPPGNWTILRIGHTSTGHTNATGGGGKGLECDKFNPAAVSLQFDKWYGEAIRQAGPALAKDVLSIFHVDSWECGSQNWSPVFAAEFRKRRGYDLMPYLPVMAGIPVNKAAVSENFLHDVRQTITELVNDHFYGTLRGLAKKNEAAFSAESVAPTMLSDGMLHYKNVDLPMGEFWLNSPTHDKPNDMLDAISGAHIYGKQIVQAEGFTQLRMSWDEHPANLKALGDRNLALGINRLVFHVFMHNPWIDRKPGMTLDAIGLFFQRDQTWWKQARGWVEYVTRCQALLQLGKPVTDIAVFTGEELPRRAILPDRLVPVMPGIYGIEKLEEERVRLSNAGQPMRQLPAGVNGSANMADPEDWIDPLRGYAYDSYNLDALMNLTSVRNGKITLSTGANYKLLVFPGAHKMSPGGRLSKEVKARIHSLVKAGATVLINDHTYTVPGMEKRNLLKGPYRQESFASIGLEPDFRAVETTGVRAGNLAWTHRAGNGFDIYFISNQQNSPRQVEVSLRIDGMIPEIWDPLTSEQRQAGSWRMHNNRTLIPVKLEGNGSVFIIFRHSATQQAANAPNEAINTKAQQVNGPWSVQFDTAYGGPGQPVAFPSLTGWNTSSDTAIRYYSGTATYSNSFHWTGAQTGRVWLNLGEVANIAEVFINGTSCGIAWTAPYRVDITKALKPGPNKITIEVSNTWANRLIGDQRLPPEKRITFTTAPLKLEGKPLLKAGLLGPVVLEVGQ